LPHLIEKTHLIDGGHLTDKGRLLAALAFALLAAGCSAVDREAAAFPEMPHNPVYYRLDGRQLPAGQFMEALQAAASACRQQTPAGTILGSAPFDSCMRAQGYGRR
jgi:hypothetical protein